jgi:hypothetical protein
MGLYSLFETDKVAEQEGIELILVDGDNEIKFQLARAGGENKKFGSRMTQLLKPYNRSIAAGTMSDEKSAQLLSQAIAETIILSWSGVTDRDGNDMEFNKENAVQLLVDLPELRSIILDEAQKAANFRNAEVAEDAKP